MVFIQKTGGGLFLHNIFHASVSGVEQARKTDQKDKEITYACSCIDDFLVPFDEPAISTVSSPVTTYTIFLSFNINDVPAQSLCLSPLRGPPAPVC